MSEKPNTRHKVHEDAVYICIKGSRHIYSFSPCWLFYGRFSTSCAVSKLDGMESHYLYFLTCKILLTKHYTCPVVFKSAETCSTNKQSFMDNNWGLSSCEDLKRGSSGSSDIVQTHSLPNLHQPQTILLTHLKHSLWQTIRLMHYLLHSMYMRW